VPRLVEPPNSLLLVVGREDFTAPLSFDGRTCAATHDCVAIGVTSVSDGPTTLSVSVEPPAHLVSLGEFRLETEGLVSVRDVHFREYDAVGAEPGWATVTVWGDDVREPAEIVVQVVEHARS